MYSRDITYGTNSQFGFDYLRDNMAQEKNEKVQKNLTFAIVDEVDNRGAVCRTKGDAPEIDGNLFIDSEFIGLKPGDIIPVHVDESSEYDLWGVPCKKLVS